MNENFLWICMQSGLQYDRKYYNSKVSVISMFKEFLFFQYKVPINRKQVIQYFIEYSPTIHNICYYLR
jgi:hypothetical protein